VDFERNKRHHVCAEVQYETINGNVHSDICFFTDMSAARAEEVRKLLHSALDEWLNQNYDTIKKTKHTGWFVVGKSELCANVLDEYGIPFQE
jgi:hypothetical protein